MAWQHFGIEASVGYIDDIIIMKNGIKEKLFILYLLESISYDGINNLIWKNNKNAYLPKLSVPYCFLPNFLHFKLFHRNFKLVHIILIIVVVN